MNALTTIRRETDVTAAPPATPPSRREKAAIVMKVLLQHGADPGINRLDDRHITQVSKIMGELGLISRQAVASALREFTTELSALGIAFEKGLDAALSSFEGHLDEAAIRRIREMNEATPALRAWSGLAEESVENLVRILSDQSSATAAVVLMRLPGETSSRVISGLPEEDAIEILKAFEPAMNVSPAYADQIAISVSAAMAEAKGAGGEAEASTKQIGAILDLASGPVQERLLERLAASAPDTAKAVRETMFTFDDISSRLPANAVGKIVAALDARTVALALIGAGEKPPEVKSFIESNLSSRLNQQIQDEMQELGTPSDTDIVDAMTEMVKTIRGLETADEITLNPRS